MQYYLNGITWDLEQESDGWWSIYEIHPVTQQRVAKIQVKDLDHAYSYCAMIEPVTVPLQQIC